MSAALELIRIVQSRGGRLWVDGEDLVIAPKNAAMPVIEALRRLKPELVEELVRRPQMPAGVQLVEWAPRPAPIRLSNCAVVTDVERFVASTLRQLDAHLRGERFLDGGWGLSDRIRLSNAPCSCFAFSVALEQ
jgi:hypothetical protein